MLINKNFPVELSNCDENYNGDKGQGYRGCKTKTLSGKLCRAWKSESNDVYEVTISKYPGKGLEGGHNYCRNPTGDI